MRVRHARESGYPQGLTCAFTVDLVVPPGHTQIYGVSQGTYPQVIHRFAVYPQVVDKSVENLIHRFIHMRSGPVPILLGSDTLQFRNTSVPQSQKDRL